MYVSFSVTTFTIITLFMFFVLLQLHTFPGFNPDELTPLPSSLTTRNVLDIVTSAQKDLNKKVSFIFVIIIINLVPTTCRQTNSKNSSTI